jgi:hypothetical protein
MWMGVPAALFETVTAEACAATACQSEATIEINESAAAFGAPCCQDVVNDAEAQHLSTSNDGGSADFKIALRSLMHNHCVVPLLPP